VLGARIQDKDCEVRVFKLSHASHRICRYEFKGEGFSVITKFFGSALVCKYVPGRSLFWYFNHRRKLEEKLELVVDMLKKLHDNTQTYYNKENEFSKFNYFLKHLKIIACGHLT